MQKPQLVAVDTNVLMRLVEGHVATIDSWHLINRRLRPVQFLAPPTVLDELASKTLDDPDLLDIDHEKLTLLFRQFDLVAPDISSPEKLLKRFYV